MFRRYDCPDALLSHPLTDAIKGTAAQLPVRRPGHVNDIAAAAVFLAWPEAGFITGELLNVNGGRVFGR